METENNVISMSEWQGASEPIEMTEEEYNSAMQELITTVDEEELGRTIAGVLEFLTMRALHDGGYYIMTDDERAITVFAADEDAKLLLDLLPPHFKSWEDDMEVPPFDTDSDPGDEQDEPTPAS